MFNCKAYYNQARIYHPDKIDEESEKAKAEEKFKEIKFAYEVLTDKSKREKYIKIFFGASITKLCYLPWNGDHLVGGPGCSGL